MNPNLGSDLHGARIRRGFVHKRARQAKHVRNSIVRAHLIDMEEVRQIRHLRAGIAEFRRLLVRPIDRCLNEGTD